MRYLIWVSQFSECRSTLLLFFSFSNEMTSCLYLNGLMTSLLFPGQLIIQINFISSPNYSHTRTHPHIHTHRVSKCNSKLSSLCFKCPLKSLHSRCPSVTNDQATYVQNLYYLQRPPSSSPSSLVIVIRFVPGDLQYNVFKQLKHQIVIAAHLQWKFDADTLFAFWKHKISQQLTSHKQVEIHSENETNHG